MQTETSDSYPCVLKAVDEHADLLRESASDPGNDHRLGAATIVLITTFGPAIESREPTIRNSNLFPVNANGDVRFLYWSLTTDDGKNLLDPGKTPHENIQFLLVLRPTDGVTFFDVVLPNRRIRRSDCTLIASIERSSGVFWSSECGG